MKVGSRTGLEVCKGKYICWNYWSGVSWIDLRPHLQPPTYFIDSSWKRSLSNRSNFIDFYLEEPTKCHICHLFVTFRLSKS